MSAKAKINEKYRIIYDSTILLGKKQTNGKKAIRDMSFRMKFVWLLYVPDSLTKVAAKSSEIIKFTALLMK